MRVACAFDVLEAPLRPRDVVTWSGLLRPERIYPLAPDERLVVVAVAGDRALVAAGDARVALRRSWLRRRASAPRPRRSRRSRRRRCGARSKIPSSGPGRRWTGARGGAARLKDRWRAGGVEAVRGTCSTRSAPPTGPRGRRGSSRRTRRATSPTSASSASDEEVVTPAPAPARELRSASCDVAAEYHLLYIAPLAVAPGRRAGVPWRVPASSARFLSKPFHILDKPGWPWLRDRHVPFRLGPLSMRDLKPSRILADQVWPEAHVLRVARVPIFLLALFSTVSPRAAPADGKAVLFEITTSIAGVACSPPFILHLPNQSTDEKLSISNPIVGVVDLGPP